MCRSASERFSQTLNCSFDVTMRQSSALAEWSACSTSTSACSYERSHLIGLSTSQEIVRSHWATSPAGKSESKRISPGWTAVGAGAQRTVTHRSTRSNPSYPSDIPSLDVTVSKRRPRRVRTFPRTSNRSAKSASTEKESRTGTGRRL